MLNKLINSIKEIKDICADCKDCEGCKLAEPDKDTGGYICRFGLVLASIRTAPCNIDVEALERI